MEEMHEESRSRLGRRGYIKRWLILIAVGVLVGGGRAFAETFLPAALGAALSLIILAFYGLPALALSVVWTMDRLTDGGKSQAWALLLLVPIVNIVTFSDVRIAAVTRGCRRLNVKSIPSGGLARPFPPVPGDPLAYVHGGRLVPSGCVQVQIQR